MNSDFIPEHVRLAVKHGANWLDENYPDWVEKINLYDLDMGDCQNCMIGQVVGDYNDIVRGDYGPQGKTVEWAQEHGFEVNDFDDMDSIYSEYVQLETVWSEEVRNRLGGN